MGCEEAARRVFRCKVAYNAARNAVYFDAEVLDRKQAWRDRRLMALIAHKKQMNEPDR